MAKTGICSHHIFCVGDGAIPYARLSALFLEMHCPQHLRDNLRIFVHIDGLRQDPQRSAKWLRRTPRTEVTSGLFGIHPKEYVPGKWHQTMVNKVSKEFAREPVLAFVDADCFVTDSSWFMAAQHHDPECDYSLAHGLRSGRVLKYKCKSFYCIQTHLFTLTPELHNRICKQRFNQDDSVLGLLLEEFPGATVKLSRGLDNMVTPSFKAQLLGYRVIDVLSQVRAVHVGGFSYMRAQKLQESQGTIIEKWLMQVPFNFKLIRLIRRLGWGAPHLSTQDQWLTRLRLNSRLLSFFERLGWEEWIDPSYAARIDEMVELVQGDSKLSNRQRKLPPTAAEKGFSQNIEPLENVLKTRGCEG